MSSLRGAPSLAVQLFDTIKGRAQALLGRIGLKADTQSLQGRIVRNASWIAIGYGGEILIRFGSSLIITRLLDPSAYGLIATVSVIMTMVFMLSDLGLRQVVLTSDRCDEPSFLQSIWTIQVLRGFALMLVLWAIAWGWHIAQVEGWIDPGGSYSSPLLPGLLALIGCTLAAMGLASINIFRLERHLDQGAVTRMDIGSRLITSLFSVVLTFWLRSAWGIAIAMALGALVRSIRSNMVLPGPRMKLRLKRADIGAILSHSRWIALSSGLGVLTSSGDKLVMGYGFGMHLLGVYAVAFALTDSLATIISRMQTSMGISILRALNDKPVAERQKAFYRFRLPIELYCLAAGLGLVFFGPLFFEIMYDPRYHEAGHFASLLGVGFILNPLGFSSNFALGQQRFKYMSFVVAIRTTVFFSTIGTAVWLGSMDMAVIAVALARLPEYLAYFLIRRGDIPFRWTRDGGLMAIAAACLVYRLTVG